jgi:hypothetical protein
LRKLLQIFKGKVVFHADPFTLRLRPSPNVSSKQIRQLQAAGPELNRRKAAGKPAIASATFSGQLHVDPGTGLPTDFTFDSAENLRVEPLPYPNRVIPICELFQNLERWKGQRIAVRGESAHGMEGSWIVGRCKGAFYTNGYRWPVGLNHSFPPNYTDAVRLPSGPPKGAEQFRSRYSVIETATYVGRLRMRAEPVAICRDGGDYVTNGYGHLNGSAAELLVEEIRDVELTKREPAASDATKDEPPCQPRITKHCALLPTNWSGLPSLGAWNERRSCSRGTGTTAGMTRNLLR